MHQTWKTEDVPDHWKPAQAAWKRYHPDWVYCFWTDRDLTDYILEKHPEFWYTWTHFQYHIQRVDAIRYFIMKDIGGVYCDLDLMPNQALDPFLEEGTGDVLLVKSANEPCYTNMFLASRGPQTRKHVDCVWTRMIRYMKMSVKEPKWYYIFSKHFQVMMTTGPLGFTYAVDQYTGTVTVLSKQRFNPFGILDAGDLSTQELYKYPVLYVLEGSSWHAWDSMAINGLLRYKWWIVTVLVVSLIVFTLLAIGAYNTHDHLATKLKRALALRHNNPEPVN